MMYKALRYRLIVDPALMAVVGTGVVWIDRPQSASARPAIVLRKVSPGRTYTTKGATTLQGTRVQFDLFGLDYRDIAPLYEALLAEMEQPETVAGINFGMAFLDSQREIGRASCLESVSKYVKISLVVVSLKKKNKNT